MSLPRQEQERLVAQYKQEHPEHSDAPMWSEIKGQMVPDYRTIKQRIEKTTPIRNEIFSSLRKHKCLRGPLSLLIYFVYHRNFPKKEDKHDTRSVWYEQKGLIVASRSVKQMAKDFGVSRQTIHTWLNLLEAEELIERHLDKRENIYVIGRIIDKKESYFYDE